MQKIRDLISPDKKVYIILNNEEIRKKFMADAEKEGITFSDGVLPTQRKAEDVMSLQKDGTICYLGWAGRICFHSMQENVLRIDYEEYTKQKD